MSSMLHAQAHPPAPDPPDIRWIVRAQDRLSDEELWGANPCRRVRMFFGSLTAEYQRLGWLPFCVQMTRSRAVSVAWKKGLDQYGARLDPSAPARKHAEMEGWLRRLPGSYRIDGRYWASGDASPVRGGMECFGIGSGPGVSCVISTEWKAPKETHKDRKLDRSLYNATRGLVLLFGIDPGTSQLRVTLVDFRAIGMSGFLDDGAVLLESRPGFESLDFFGNPLVTYTWANALVAMKPGGDLGMTFLVRALNSADILPLPRTLLFDLQLHRERPVKAQ